MKLLIEHYITMFIIFIFVFLMTMIGYCQAKTVNAIKIHESIVTQIQSSYTDILTCEYETGLDGKPTSTCKTNSDGVVYPLVEDIRSQVATLGYPDHIQNAEGDEVRNVEIIEISKTANGKKEYIITLNYRIDIPILGIHKFSYQQGFAR